MDREERQQVLEDWIKRDFAPALKNRSRINQAAMILKVAMEQDRPPDEALQAVIGLFVIDLINPDFIRDEIKKHGLN